jgi:hypothetical protein
MRIWKTKKKEMTRERCMNNVRVRSSALLIQKYEKISILLKELVQDDIKKVCKFMKKQLAEEPSIKKELGKIVENPKLKTKILTFCGKMICKEIKKNIKYIKQSGINILNYEKESEDVLFESMEKIELLLSESMTIFADAYLLARVFKNFNMSEMEKKAYKGATDQPDHANNIIIYCGNTHANKYRNFLEPKTHPAQLAAAGIGCRLRRSIRAQGVSGS